MEFNQYTPYPHIKIAQSLWLRVCHVLLSIMWLLVLCLCACYLCNRCDSKVGLVVCIVFANILVPMPIFIWHLLKKINSIKMFQCKILANLGCPRAQYELASVYLSESGFDKVSGVSMRWLQKAASRGDVFAMWKLALVYLCNDACVRNLRKAFNCLFDAAKGGHVGAICAIGRCYEKGIGIEKCPEEAVVWYLKAANYGLAPALHNMGCCYRMGIGIEKDEEEAVVWFDRAAEQGFYDHFRSWNDGTENSCEVIEHWNLRLLSCQPGWNKQFTDEFLSSEFRLLSLWLQRKVAML